MESLHSVKPSPGEEGLTPREEGTSPHETKKIKKVEGKKKNQEDKSATPPEIKLYREVSKKFPNTANFEDVVALIKKFSERIGRAVLPEDLRPFYKEWTGRGYNQFSIKWLEWAVTGTIPSRNGGRQIAPTKPAPSPAALEAAKRAAQSLVEQT